ncbi:MAG TPA: hypothetical protein VI278_17515 [Nitrososphaeraceae archaeon]
MQTPVTSIVHEKLRYDKIVKSYNEDREYGGIKGLNPFEMFLEIN